jgi:hypothetical protein
MGKGRLRGGCTNDGMQPGDVPKVIEYALIDFDDDFSAQDICSCVPSSAFVGFAAHSKHAIDTMVKKTPEAMRRGLQEFGEATAVLAEQAEETCSKNKKTFGILKDIGWLMQPDNSDEDGFQYAPLERLSLNGRDIFDEMNKFLLEFFSNSEAKEVGLALANLFEALTIKEEQSEQEEANTQIATGSEVDVQHIHA